MREEECCFIRNNQWFRYRTAAIIVEDDQALFVTSKNIDFFYTAGGAVNLGENSKDTIIRELKEETGKDFEVLNLSMIIENFFTGHGGNLSGMDCQCIEFYYKVRPIDDKPYECHSVDWKDSPEEMVWIPIKDIKNYNIRPSFLKDHIEEIIHSDKVLHFITEADRDEKKSKYSI